MKEWRVDYHQINGSIHMSTIHDEEWSEEEIISYNNTLSKILEDNFEIKLISNLTKEDMVSFGVKDGVLIVRVSDSISQE